VYPFDLTAIKPYDADSEVAQLNESLSNQQDGASLSLDKLVQDLLPGYLMKINPLCFREGTIADMICMVMAWL